MGVQSTSILATLVMDVRAEEGFIILLKRFDFHEIGRG